MIPSHTQQRDRAREILGQWSVILVEEALKEARAALNQKRFRGKNRLSEILAALEVYYVHLWRALGVDMPTLFDERLLLAKLAAPRPMFDNPLIGWAAQTLRDDVLRDAGELPSTSQLTARAGLERIAAANGAPIEDVPLR